MKAATCPICKINLSFSVKDKCRYCIPCKREFWPFQEQQENKTLLEQYDIETVSSSESGGAEGPVLICDDSDLKTWPKGYNNRNRKKDYLAEHFPNTTIETRKYIPT